MKTSQILKPIPIFTSLKKQRIKYGIEMIKYGGILNFSDATEEGQTCERQGTLPCDHSGFVRKNHLVKEVDFKKTEKEVRNRR